MVKSKAIKNAGFFLFFFFLFVHSPMPGTDYHKLLLLSLLPPHISPTVVGPFTSKQKKMSPWLRTNVSLLSWVLYIHAAV